MKKLFAFHVPCFKFLFDRLLHLFNFAHERRKLCLSSLALKYLINTSDNTPDRRYISYLNFLRNWRMLKLFNCGDGFLLIAELEFFGGDCDIENVLLILRFLLLIFKL